MKWTEEEHNYLVELRKQNYSWQEIAKEMTKKFGKTFTKEKCRARWRRQQKKTDKPEYKATIEIKSDGTQVSDRLIEIYEQDLKDESYLLEAHGYDPSEWEISSAKSSMWQHHNKQDGTKTLYASKIAVKPKENRFTLKDLVGVIKENTKPIKIKIPAYKIKEKRLLEIPLFDQHFGVSDYEYYQPTQAKIHEILTSRVWQEVLFVIGQDMLHHNDHRNRTASGREIQHVDITKAWEDARKFYEPLIEKAFLKSAKVKIMFNKGNHDESLSWAFVQMMKAKYPQATFDDTFEERKVHTFGECFIGFTHGDKGRKDLHNIFPVEYPTQWSKAKVREIHTGHFHREDGKDVFGMMIRTLATKNKTDQWHKDNGYVGKHKRFMLFEYSENALESIHYV